MKRTICFTVMMRILIVLCFSQETNDLDNLESMKSILLIIEKTFNEEKHIINNQEFENILIFLNNTFNEYSSRHRFKFDSNSNSTMLTVSDGMGNDARLFLVFDYRRSYLDIFEYIYISGSLKLNEKVHNIEIMKNSEYYDNGNNNYIFTFTSTDNIDKFHYTYVYFTSGVKMFLISIYDNSIDGPSYPLLREYIINRDENKM